MQWIKPTTFPVLLENEVHVWWAALDATDEEENQYFSMISSHEQSRARRFHFIKDYKRFTVSHGILRFLLAHYANCDPLAIRYGFGHHGKPELLNNRNLQFNMSHSQNMALYAITHHAAVGIDIETMEKKHDIEGIAERFFSLQESTLLKSLPEEAKAQAFFNGWSRKEAFLKALGEGLSFSLQNVEVTMAPGQNATILALHDSKLSLSDWFLYDLRSIPQFAAALVVKSAAKTLRVFKYDRTLEIPEKK